jgi:hypothetical protein
MPTVIDNTKSGGSLSHRMRSRIMIVPTPTLKATPPWQKR